jgi:hypothetical protein
MKSLKISPTRFTPKVLFDPKKLQLEIQGYSLPENAEEFYTPVMECLSSWQGNCLIDDNEFFHLVFKIDYLDTGSLKKFVSITNLLSNSLQDSDHLQIDWYYHSQDSHLKQIGKDLSGAVNLPINFFEQ